MYAGDARQKGAAVSQTRRSTSALQPKGWCRQPCCQSPMERRMGRRCICRESTLPASALLRAAGKSSSLHLWICGPPVYCCLLMVLQCNELFFTSTCSRCTSASCLLNHLSFISTCFMLRLTHDSVMLWPVSHRWLAVYYHVLMTLPCQDVVFTHNHCTKLCTYDHLSTPGLHR